MEEIRESGRIKYFLSFGLSVLLLLLLSACSKVSDEELSAAHKAVQDGALIIDVRTAEEYRSGHIESAVNIPLQVMDKAYLAIPRDKVLVVYCHSGNRSAVAADFLRQRGWKVYDVATQEEWERELK